MTTKCHSFRQVRFTENCQGYPCLAAVSHDEVIVGDWSGNLVRVRLSPFAVETRVFAAGRIFGTTPVNNPFRSLSPAPDDPGRCAVATRGAHAVVWDCENGTLRQVAANVGPVHSVAWLDSTHLLLGTGDYSLGPGAGRQARLEVWHLDGDEPSCVGRVALPGTCVDAIAVAEDGPRRIAAFSGLKSQDRGFLTVLDAASLLPISVFDFPFAMAGRVECTEDLILVSNGGTVRAICRENGGEKWCHETANEATDFAYDADSHQLLLSTGELISAGRGRVLATWPVLGGCCCVRPRPEGGFVGVSKSGMIGVWDVEP